MSRLVRNRVPDTPVSIGDFSSPDVRKQSRRPPSAVYTASSEVSDDEGIKSVPPVQNTVETNSNKHPIYSLTEPANDVASADDVHAILGEYKFSNSSSIPTSTVQPKAGPWMSAREHRNTGEAKDASKTSKDAPATRVSGTKRAFDAGPQSLSAMAAATARNKRARFVDETTETVSTRNPQHVTAPQVIIPAPVPTAVKHIPPVAPKVSQPVQKPAQTQSRPMRNVIVSEDEDEIVVSKTKRNIAKAVAETKINDDTPPIKRQLRRLRHAGDTSSEEEDFVELVDVNDAIAAAEVDEDISALCSHIAVSLDDMRPLVPLVRKAKDAKAALSAVAKSVEREAADSVSSKSGVYAALVSVSILSDTLGIQCSKREHARGLYLSPHQLIGVNWMYMLHKAHVNGVLADAMGLGKTVQVAAFLAYLHVVEPAHNPHLIITPASTAANWVRELHKWAPALRVATYNVGSDKGVTHIAKRVGSSPVGKGNSQDVGAVVIMDDRDPTTAVNGRSFDVLVTTYSVFDRSGTTAGSQRQQLVRMAPYEYVILDEGHAIKNANSSRHKNITRIAKNAHHRLLLSGTPFQNDLAELTSLLRFVAGSESADVGAESAISALESAVVGASDAHKSQALSFLLRICEPFILRRHKHEVLSELPPKVDEWVELEMPPLQRGHYDAILSEAKSKNRLDDSQKKHLFTMLRKAAQHPLLSQTTRYKHPNTRFSLASLFQKTGVLAAEGETSKERHARVLRAMNDMSDYDLHLTCVRCLGNDDDFGGVCSFKSDEKEGNDAANSWQQPIEWTDKPAAKTRAESSSYDYEWSDAPSCSLAQRCVLPVSALLCSSKFRFLADKLPELLRTGHKVLLFSQWTTILDMIEELLHHLSLSFYRLDGSTPVSERQAIIDDFSSEDSDARIFLLSTRSGGLGLNLVAADTVILFDSDLNPTLDAQAVDRAHRIGQRNPVHVMRLCNRNSVDSVIKAIAERKSTLTAAIDEEHHKLVSSDTDTAAIHAILQMAFN